METKEADPITEAPEVKPAPPLPSFVADRKALIKEVEIAGRVVEKKSTIPILGNLLLEAKGKTLTITGTDLKIGAVTQCEIGTAKKAEPGSITVPSKQFLATLKGMPGDSVQISQIGFAITVQSIDGGVTASLDGMSHESFPELPAVPDFTHMIPASVFRDAIKRTLYAISLEESRFTLNGDLLEIKDGKLRMVAADGHRLGYVEHPHDGPEMRTLIPKRALVQLAKLAEKAEWVSMAHNDDHLFFGVDGRILIARKLTGNFPDYARMLPNDADTLHAAVVGTKALSDAMKRAEKYADERSRAVIMAFGPKGIELRVTISRICKYNETVPAQYAAVPARRCAQCRSIEKDEAVELCKSERLNEFGKGVTCGGELIPLDAGIEVGINCRYVLDFLASTSEDQVGIMMTDEKSATKWKPVGNAGTLGLMAPMRM